MYKIVNVCKQSLISGGGQLLGNADDVKIPLGSGLPSCSKWFQVISMYAWFMRYGFLKNTLYLF